MRNKEKSTNIYFVRHGQTDFPTDRIYCDDREDPELNKNGLYQASHAANYLKDKELSAIYASPAKRTQMTASAISQVSGVLVKTDNRWVERRFGIWEGLFFQEIEEKFPEQYLAWKKDKVRYTPEKGETIEDVRNRLTGSLETLVQRHSGENIAVVSHVGPIRIAVCDAMAIPLGNYRQLRIDYASVSRIDYGQTLNNLITLNYINY
ncbi:MAG: histidine phosphatase family protein [Gammaproteobacteria bacterium]|nr:histidine phosphatase family protein [Gammaproteobacteria bacterium]